MIMHLSAPAESSINDGIIKDDFTLHYGTIDNAVQMVNRLGRNTLLAKVDIKSAFHTIPVRVEDRALLGIHWRQQFYVDCCLPFGLRSAPLNLSFINMRKPWSGSRDTHISNIIHCFDDFLIAGKPVSPDCQWALMKMLKVCARLGFPIADRKVEGPTMVIIFLDILLDAAKMELRLPQDKLETLMALQCPTIRLYLAAIRAEHLNRGLAEPMKDSEQLKLLLQGL